MSLTFSTQAVIAFKNLQGKSNTDSVGKGVNNESTGIFFNVSSNSVWIQPISPTPSISVSSGVAIAVTASLVYDNTSNGHAYFSTWPTTPPSGIDPVTLVPYSYGSGVLVKASSGSIINNSISPSYGYLYGAKPYDSSLNPISVGDVRNWIYQYNSGVFFQEEVVGLTPSTISLYVYVGEYLSDISVNPYTNINSVQNSVGGISQGTTFNGTTTNQMFDLLAYPNLQANFTSFSFNSGGNVLEVGNPINAGTYTFNWGTTFSGNIVPSTIKIVSGTGGILVAGASNSGSSNLYVGLINPQVATSSTWQISATRTNNTSMLDTYTVNWNWRLFYGSTSSDITTSSGIQGLNGYSLPLNRFGTYSLSGVTSPVGPTGLGGVYKYFAIPSVIGEATSFVDSLSNMSILMAGTSSGFTFSSNGICYYRQISVMNGYGATTNYNLYRSKNNLNGPMNIVIN